LQGLPSDPSMSEWLNIRTGTSPHHILLNASRSRLFSQLQASSITSISFVLKNCSIALNLSASLKLILLLVLFRYMLSFVGESSICHEFIRANKNGYRLDSVSRQIFPTIKSLIKFYRVHPIRNVKLTNGRGDFGASYRTLLKFVILFFFICSVILLSAAFSLPLRHLSP
jgi:hypothetical protein